MFLNAMKNFLEAKFQLFGSNKSSIFFQKIALNRPKKFSKCFLAKLLKKFGQRFRGSRQK